MEEKETKQEETLSKHDFYFETPLYKTVTLSGLEDKAFEGDVDAYSTNLNSDTTYTINTRISDVWDVWDQSAGERVNIGFFKIKLTCKRKTDDTLTFFVFRNTKQVTKVGQMPSLADLQYAEIGKKYDKVLADEDLKNLKKAIGLVAHGAGAGSFVYLRRIFENLIFETFENNASSLSVTETEFKFQRMEDKVETLKSFLPSQLVEMKSIYGILSKGVHELTEEECLEYFGPLKLSIELILDQKIEVVQKAERDAEVKKQLQDIQKNIAHSATADKKPSA